MNKRLVEKFLEDQCTAEEARKVLYWFRTPEGQQYLNEEIDKDIRAYQKFDEYFEFPDVRSEQLFSRIQKTKSDNRVDSDSKDYKTGWKKAAGIIFLAVALCVFAGVYLYNLGPEKKIVKTEQGDRKTLFLPDSSKVILRSNSSIEYLSAFEEREVVLKGEAYFDIKHSGKNNFIVFKDDSYIKVLGTVFTVKEVSARQKIEVAVKKGRVELGKIHFEDDLTAFEKLISSKSQTLRSSSVTQLSANKSQGGNNSIEVSAHEVGTIDQQGVSSILSDSIYSAQAFGWVHEKVTFQRTPLRRVVSKLEDRYGVQFVFRDSELANKKFTSSFDDESLKEVLKVLTISLDITYEKTGNKIYFSNKR